MQYQLGVQERDDIFKGLTNEQQHFIMNHIKRGKRTVFANIMARDKGSFITNDMTDEEIELILEEWVFVDYIDGGEVREDLKCECGRSLRYQYVVKNKKTDQIRKFGIDHFKQHTGLASDIVKDVVRGFENIDYEFDEICYKVKAGVDNKPELPKNFTLPSDIAPFYTLKLPLLDRQIKRLKEKINVFDMERRDSHMSSVEYDSDSPIDFKDGYEQNGYSRKMTDADHSTYYVQTDLFGGNEPTKEISKSSYQQFILNDTYKKAIVDYLEQGVESARVMTELLIKHHDAPDERYQFSLTGKPRIYPYVASYIDSLVSENKYVVIEADSTDRRYRAL